MNEHGITRENLLRSLPVSLAGDPSLSALADSISGLLAQQNGEINRLSIYPHIDTLDEALLDILAHDFKVDWWDSDYTLEEKRRTLQSSWQVHKTLGTKAAVEKAVSAIYPNTTVTEWFEYDGEPYHFRVTARLADGAWDPGKHKQLKQWMQYYKNLRSWMDSIAYQIPPAVLKNHQALYLTSLTILVNVNNLGIEQILLNGKRVLDGTWLLSPVFAKGTALSGFAWGMSVKTQSRLLASLYFRVQAATAGTAAAEFVCCARVKDPQSAQFTSFKWIESTATKSQTSAAMCLRFRMATSGAASANLQCRTSAKTVLDLRQENFASGSGTRNTYSISAGATEQAHRKLNGAFLLDGSKNLLYGTTRSDL